MKHRLEVSESRTFYETSRSAGIRLWQGHKSTFKVWFYLWL